jgi:hypothetical protein
MQQPWHGTQRQDDESLSVFASPAYMQRGISVAVGGYFDPDQDYFVSLTEREEKSPICLYPPPSRRPMTLFGRYMALPLVEVQKSITSLVDLD